MAKVNLNIDSVEIDTTTTDGAQIATLVLSYSGTEDLASQMIQEEQLTIELPSHAPPPEQAGKKK